METFNLIFVLFLSYLFLKYLETVDIVPSDPLFVESRDRFTTVPCANIGRVVLLRVPQFKIIKFLDRTAKKKS